MSRYYNKPAERHPGRRVEQEFTTRRFLTKRQYLRDLELLGRINNPGWRCRPRISIAPVAEHLDTLSRRLAVLRIASTHNAALLPENGAEQTNGGGLPEEHGASLPSGALSSVTGTTN
jgi:hypothetical protein